MSAPDTDPARYTLLLIPDESAGPVRQIKLTTKTIRNAVVAGGAALGLLGAGTILGLAALPALVDHDGLVAENLFLREQLQDVETELDDIDGTLQRVRLYDAQLRELLREAPASPGSFGPLEPDEVEALGLDPRGVGAIDEDHEGWEDAWDEQGQVVQLEAADLRPAEAWSMAVQARTEDFVSRLERLEPRMSMMAEDMEDLLSLRRAFPSVWPVPGAILTSGFGYRSSPITGRRKFHSGVDLSAERGTRVYAVSRGVVAMADYNSGYGRMVEIDHGLGIVSRYAHNSSVFVEQGDWVDAGQVIATVGTTGQTTGPHLHFELIIGGEAVDPLEHLPTPD
ncbi:MAG: M23 family metallopeptidase [Proteobacteria bacterium]|nr:M23 family metallopeptidase [Pseudomonadota bacterium]MCP4921489.1 M23 family metallopeptidase [Pseudomonadota bacterium]